MAFETGFGWIRINGKRYDTDVVMLDLNDGKLRITERDRTHAEIKYGTSHVIDVDEIKRYWEDVGYFFLGTGQYGMARLDPRARDWLARKGARVYEERTPDALLRWGRTPGRKLGIFHVTC